MKERGIICFIMISIIAACGEKKTSLSGNSDVDVKDFINAFPKISYSKSFEDTSIQKIADTTTIGYTVFTGFVPDSVLQRQLGNTNQNTIIHPVGSIEKENEIYLLANFIINKKIKMIAFVFDKKTNQYKSSLELLSNSNDGYRHSVSITSEPTFMLSRVKITKDNNMLYTRNGFGFNKAAGDFIIVVTDTNEDVEKNDEVINPIDTFPKKNKYSGDYIKDKKNFISLRDGRNAEHYIFYIYFEKKGECKGELKGEMRMHDATTAYYQESGDPCIIDFTFNGSNLKVKEQGNCGNHRGIKCFFDDSYKKKKEEGTK